MTTATSSDMKFVWCFNSEANARKCAELIDGSQHGSGTLVKRATDIGDEVGWDLCVEAGGDAAHHWCLGFAYAFVCLTPGEDP